MDPITSTIIAGVAWFFLGSVVAVIIYFVIFGLSVLLAAAIDQEWIAAVGVLVAWLAAVGWEIFVWVQIIICIVTLIQLLQV